MIDQPHIFFFIFYSSFASLASFALCAFCCDTRHSPPPCEILKKPSSIAILDQPLITRDGEFKYTCAAWMILRLRNWPTNRPTLSQHALVYSEAFLDDVPSYVIHVIVELELGISLNKCGNALRLVLWNDGIVVCADAYTSILKSWYLELVLKKSSCYSFFITSDFSLASMRSGQSVLNFCDILSFFQGGGRSTNDVVYRTLSVSMHILCMNLLSSPIAW